MRLTIARVALGGLGLALVGARAQALDRARLYDKSLIYGIDFKYGGPPAEQLPAVRQAMLDMALAYGATITRAGIGWAGVEPVRGQDYDWEKADRKASYLSQHGLPVCVSLATAPEWAIGATPEIKRVFEHDKALDLICGMSIKDEFWPDYERYLTALVRRYGDTITYYDIWNEPDGMGNPSVQVDPDTGESSVKWGGDPAWYAKLLKHSAAVLRKEDPDCIIGGGCLESKSQPTSQFLEDVYKAGGGPYFDAVSMHSYGRPFNFDWIRAVRSVMVNNGDGDKPIWITEYGLNWQRNDGVSEEAKAALMRAALRYLRETPWLTMGLIHHATPILWNQDPQDPTKLTPRPALIAFKQTKQEGHAATSFATGFEDDWDLTYWYYELEGGSAAFPPVTLSDEDAHAGKRSLRAQANGKWVEPFGGVNVRSKSPTLSFWYKIVPADPAAKAKLSLEIRPGDLTLPRYQITLSDDAPVGRWTRADLAIAERAPELAGNTIVDLGIKAETDRPGVTLFLDDLSVN
jgi:hypothetical protein